ncbi:uncharacterized protein LOC136747810 [Amia ocellicauda]|uniref:uncharacterized protein LOC136747810 n=1 Tax=Amia ocellicauda TaxID=2972642 RepID=UPI0034641449
MTVLELDMLTNRFRVIESLLGLVGCFCVIYAVWTPYWLGNGGLWNGGNDTHTDIESQDLDSTGGQIFKVLEAERVFAVLTFLMAVSGASLCIIFIFCWSSKTTCSYSNARSLLKAGQALYPTTLLLVILFPTGFFFILCWSLFTRHHKDEITNDITQLGSSYWLGAVGWVLLLGILPVVFVVEQSVCPDPMAEAESLLNAIVTSPHKNGKHCHSEGWHMSSVKSELSCRSLP